MVSRMDKYHVNSAQPIRSRSQKNERLYEDLYTNRVLTEFTQIENNNVIDLSNTSNVNSSNKRENFQKNKQLFLENQEPQRTIFLESDHKTPSEEDITEKNYNINDVLEEARKNRKLTDEMDKKRHLKTVEYSILSDLSQEKLKEYHEKKQKLTKDEEENLEELIHTITSNSLRKKIDDELLSDLLPSEESETVISKQMLEDIETEKQSTIQEEDDQTSEQKIDQSFYTKSMELSRKDFEFDEEDESFLEDTKMSLFKKLAIIFFVLVVVGVIGYIIYRFI